LAAVFAPWRAGRVNAMEGLARDSVQRSDDLRRANSARVLRAVRAAGSVSRTDLAQKTQLSPATISAIISTLFEQGAVRASAGASGAARRGRPQVALELNPNAGCVAAVALSLNSATLQMQDFTGRVFNETTHRLETLSASGADIVASLARLLQHAIAANPAGAPPVRQISLGVQGVTDIGHRSMLWSPITLGPVALADGLEAALSLPVTVANDCDVTAIALQHMDPVRHGGDFVAITHTRGIGMSMVVGGRLFSGVRSSAAEFGHMVFEHQGALCRCGRRGCIEAYAGDYAIMRNAFGAPPTELPAGEISRDALATIAERAEAGEGPERDAIRIAARAIGVGLKNIYALIDPAPLAMVGFGNLAPFILERELMPILTDVFRAAGEPPISVAWHPDAQKLILRGAAERGLELLEQRLAAPSDSAQPAAAE
jgi:predicted NBD/HSP70 family sugar kinase